jgi:hypothetical protein
MDVSRMLTPARGFDSRAIVDVVDRIRWQRNVIPESGRLIALIEVGLEGRVARRGRDGSRRRWVLLPDS